MQVSSTFLFFFVLFYTTMEEMRLTWPAHASPTLLFFSLFSLVITLLSACHFFVLRELKVTYTPSREKCTVSRPVWILIFVGGLFFFFFGASGKGQ